MTNKVGPNSHPQPEHHHSTSVFFPNFHQLPHFVDPKICQNQVIAEGQEHQNQTFALAALALAAGEAVPFAGDPTQLPALKRGGEKEMGSDAWNILNQMLLRCYSDVHFLIAFFEPKISGYDFVGFCSCGKCMS